MILDKANSLDNAEYPIQLSDGSYNGIYIILKWLFGTHLNHDRPVVDLGCYTARHLQWLLPICAPLHKKIECLDSFSLINETNKKALCKEIEDKWSHKLVTWTWDDASNSKYMSEADFILIGTDHSFPIEEHMFKTKHACVWSGSMGMDYIWPRIANYLHTKKLHLLVQGPNLITITNDVSIVKSFRDNIKYFNKKLESYDQHLEDQMDVIRLRQSKSNTSMAHKLRILNNFDTKQSNQE
tara:strand:- start:206 stop:925 length:720 start_codon:yes stop_codon:yes gene_type:complete